MLGRLKNRAKLLVEKQIDAIMQKDGGLLACPVFLGLGSLYYFSLTYEPPLFVIVFFTLALIAGFSLYWPYRHKSSRHVVVFYFLSAALLFMAGLSSAGLNTQRLKSPILEKELKTVRVEGRISKLEHLERPQDYRILLEDLSIEKLKSKETPTYIRIKVRGKSAEEARIYQIGQRVEVLAGLNPPSPPVVPGGFDFQRYAYYRQIGAFGFAYHKPKILDEAGLQGSGYSFLRYVEGLRTRINGRVRQKIEGSNQGILIALMTGQRSAIQEEQWTILRDAGLAHMVAISGLHVGLMASVIFMVLRLVMVCIPSVAVKYPIKKYAAILTFMILCFYVLVVGSSVTTVRALLMTGVVLFAVLLDRQALSIRLVALAAMVILLSSPHSIVEPSFQMSFAAVTALIVFYDRTRRYWTAWYSQAGNFRKIMLYMCGVTMTTIVASVATAPFVVYHFQHLSVTGNISNLVAVPVLGVVVMPAIVLSYVLMPLGIEGIGLYIADIGVGWIVSIAKQSIVLPFAVFHTKAVSSFAVLLCSLAALSCIILKGRSRWVSLATVTVIILFFTPQNQHLGSVSSSGKLIALVDFETMKMRLSTRVQDRFSAENWLRRYGQEKEETEKLPFEYCDEWACRYDVENIKISYVHHEHNFLQECDWADIVISAQYLPYWMCDNARVISRSQLKKLGAHVIYQADSANVTSASDMFIIKTVGGVRGDRPWTIVHSR